MKIQLQGIPIVISAPSGAGKTTICKLMSQRFKEVVTSISATTRQIRNDEKNGVNYFFLSEKEFRKRINEGRFIEWAKVHNHFYGTPKKKFQETLKKGKNIIMDIDVQGGINIKKLYPDGIYIFLLTKKVEVLKRRLVHRKTDTKKSISERMRNARKELQHIHKFDYLVINNTIENTLDTISAILIAEGCLTKRNNSIIKSFKRNLEK